MTALTRKRGDTYADEFAILDSAGAAQNIAGYSFVMTVDPDKNPTSASNNLFALVGAITDAAAGIVEFAPTALQADQTPNKYWYDVQMTDAGGKIRTIEHDSYTITQDISK